MALPRPRVSGDHHGVWTHARSVSQAKLRFLHCYSSTKAPFHPLVSHGASYRAHPVGGPSTRRLRQCSHVTCLPRRDGAHKSSCKLHLLRKFVAAMPNSLGSISRNLFGRYSGQRREFVSFLADHWRGSSAPTTLNLRLKVDALGLLQRAHY